MAQESNAFDTYEGIGNREDLTDTIFNISPTETPFCTGAGRSNATATLHEWQTDALADAAANAQLEGDAIATDTSSPTVRVTNHTQILRKTARITGTQEVVNKAGRKSEMAYQMAKRSQEIKRDLEFVLVGANTAKLVGGATTARLLGSVPAWIVTNDSIGASGGATAYAAAARTDGTQRALTEDLLKDTLQSTWTAGGNPGIILANAFNRRVISGFTGGATRLDRSEDKKLVATFDIYVSDWGELKVVPDRFMRTREILCLDMEYWKIAWLRPFFTKELGNTGDSTGKYIIGECTLESCNEAASGGVFDLTTS